MMSDIQEVIEEKFTRCPHCRSFSVRQADDLNPEEKLRARFVSMAVFICDNCSYRFTLSGHISSPITRLKLSLAQNKSLKRLLIAVPLVLVIVAAAVVFLPGLMDSGNGGPPVSIDQPVQQVTPKTGTDTEPPSQQQQTETPKPPDQQPDRQPDDQKTDDQPTDDQTPDDQAADDQNTGDQTPVKPAESVAEIVLGGSNRFGVNWTNVANGVEISRMSDGPLKQAGLQIKDVLVEVDGRPVTDGNLLLRIRNEIFTGKRSDALVKVNRAGKTVMYRLIKDREEFSDEGSAAFRESIEGVGSIRLFTRNRLKVRSSARDEEAPAHRWVFSRKAVWLKREAHQRVYIAGDAAGDAKWGVDDQLQINDAAYDGLAAAYRQKNGYLPDAVTRAPLDITELVPPGKKTELRIQLVDHGKVWGNTEIHIVIK